MVIAPKPTADAETWAGDMMEPHLVGQMISRSTLRLHIFGQDMRSGVELPAHGDLKWAGLDCGVSLQNVQPAGKQVSQSALTKQLYWARMLHHVQTVTAPALKIRAHQIPRPRSSLTCPVFECEAF